MHQVGERRVKIAIIGAGVAGLTAAYVLCEQHEVTLYERESRLGGHAHTVMVPGGDSEYPVDTGFLVYNDATYPRFIELLDRLGVASKLSTMSFSYQDLASGLEWKGTNLNSIFAQRRNVLRPRFWRMVREILAFNRTLRDLLKNPIDPELTLAQLLATRRWSREFLEWYLIPMGAAIWSAEPSTFSEIPARTFAEFFSRHGLLNIRGRPAWRTIDGGSVRYVQRIRERLDIRGKVRTSTPVVALRRADEGVDVLTATDTSRFDHAILACHSDEALAILSDPTKAESEVLSAIRYQPNDVTLHWDTSLMPRRKRAWAAWNYRRAPGDGDVATLTYDVSTLQSLTAPRTFLVSLNSHHAIDPAKILARFTYAHPVLDRATVRAQQLRHTLTGNHTSFCGAYFGYGFHEDGVRSALEICDALGVAW
jgi:predicted NAD/FAD-binding protein